MAMLSCGGRVASVSSHSALPASARKSGGTSSGLLGTSAMSVAWCGIVSTSECRVSEEREARREVGTPTT
jgi:hypothetical protein